MKRLLSWILLSVTLFWTGALHGSTLNRVILRENADRTTQMARRLVLIRIEEIAGNGHCVQIFGHEMIDLDVLRRTAQRTKFYDATDVEGDLKFSSVVGKPASPDQTLRTLALAVDADAFVLGYFDENQYVRTRNVVVTRGYHQQRDPRTGMIRPSSTEEKQSLLLHELLHIALNKDDDDLNSRALCPLRLLAFCPRSPSAI
jgi:hypothetical protein